MTVETTMQKMFDEYPDLFSTRADCLDHLFCTIGDGYEWVHGQLVECGTYGETDENDYLNPPMKRACQTDENIAKRRKENRELHDLKRENDLEDGLPDIGLYDPDKRHWYPLSKHSHIMNLPDDIRDDWREAANECLKMLVKDGIDVVVKDGHIEKYQGH